MFRYLGSTFFHGPHVPYVLDRYRIGFVKVHRLNGYDGFPKVVDIIDIADTFRQVQEMSSLKQ